MLIARYARERLGAIVPVAVALAGIARATRGSPARTGLLADLLLAAGLTAQARIWDDLADRARDALRHPQRVLVRAARARSLIWTCALLAAANAAALAACRPPRLVLAYLTALAGLALWYAHRGARTSLGDRVLLAKYPVFTWLLAGDSLPGRVGGLGLAAVYLGACVYESWHDPDAPAGVGLRRLEIALLCASLGGLAWSIGGRA